MKLFHIDYPHRVKMMLIGCILFKRKIFYGVEGGMRDGQFLANAKTLMLKKTK